MSLLFPRSGERVPPERHTITLTITVEATSRLHLPEACADGDALGVDECGQLRLGLLVRDARLREASAAAHGADLPHLKRVRARVRVRVRVRVGTAGHAGQVTLTLAQT